MRDTPSLLLTAAALVYSPQRSPSCSPRPRCSGRQTRPRIPSRLCWRNCSVPPCSFAMLNWLQRRSTIGGIYPRPLTVANLAHTMPARLALGRFGLGRPFEPLALPALVAYAALAVAFGLKLFTTPASVAEVQ